MATDFNVLQMADHVEGVVNVTDHLGKSYEFRKYHWMGRIGLTDREGKEILLPALHSRTEIKIFHNYEAIIAGNKKTGWEVFSLDLKLLYPDPIKPIRKIYKKLKERQKDWL